MFKVPERVLQKLICAHCGGYLSSRPIMISKSDEQICGKCFKILPDDKRDDCLRETGLEAVAEVLIFPCRYNLQGCNYVFLWDHEKDHESKCRYRYNTLPVDEAFIFNNNNGDEHKSSAPAETMESQPEYTWESNEIKLKIRCENVHDVYLEGDDKVKLRLDIAGNNGNKIYLSKLPKNTDKNEIRLSVESLLTLTESLEVSYCYVSVENQKEILHRSQQEEPSYETIPSVYSVHCNKCRKVIVNDEIYHCLFGHNSCKACKGAPCLICGKEIIGESRFYCKNFHKGCKQLFKSDDIKKHEIDCEFNNFKCPLEDCNFSGPLDILIQHFVQQHQKDVISANTSNLQFENKDKEFYFYCFDSLFHGKYYFYNTFVEFIVKYVGSNDSAIKYKYEVVANCEHFKGNTKRRSKCLGWNEVSLEKAIVFEIKDDFNRRLKFNATITII